MKIESTLPPFRKVECVQFTSITIKFQKHERIIGNAFLIETSKQKLYSRFMCNVKIKLTLMT